MTEPGPALPDWLAHRAATSPSRLALIAGGREWTYQALDAEVVRTARRLAGLGVRPGDRVATLLHNGPGAVLLTHATRRLGATLLPLNIRLTPAELAWQIEDATPRLLVADARTAEVARDACRTLATVAVIVLGSDGTLGAYPEAEVSLHLDAAPDDVLAIVYTSGTTGRPKGAMLTVGNFWWSALGSAMNLGQRDDDRWLATMSLFHVGGLSILLRSAIYGGAAIVHEGFDPLAVNRAIDDEGVTLVSVVATMLQRMLDARGDAPYPPTLRAVLLGGGPAPRVLLERCAARGIPVVQTYGLTETTSQLATLAPSDVRSHLGSAGRALYPNRMRIAGASSPEDEGEILVRGPVVMAGYHGRPAETARAIVDGWLHTGDIGRIDADGFLYVLDRRDDLIITGGENVYPAEVEATLLAHPLVAEAAVVGVADETWGSRVVALVRLGETAPPADVVAQLAAHCRASLAAYKTPREIIVATAPLPRTASGKLRRAEVRASLAGPRTPPISAPGTTPGAS